MPDMPGRRFIYAVDHRRRTPDGREEYTMAYLSPDRDMCLEFMVRNKDTSKREGQVWWWAITLNLIETDWCLDLDGTNEEDLWIYSWDGELMNYQPLGGYQECGPIDPDYPAPLPPPKMAGG